MGRPWLRDVFCFGGVGEGEGGGRLWDGWGREVVGALGWFQDGRQ